MNGITQAAAGWIDLTWDSWWRLAALSGERLARYYACARCGALPVLPCLASTGITASRPCPRRVADALAELPVAAGYMASVGAL